jgi:hypothetical protein
MDSIPGGYDVAEIDSPGFIRPCPVEFVPPSLKILDELMIMLALIVEFPLFRMVTVQPNPPLMVIVTSSAITEETKTEYMSSEVKIMTTSVFFICFLPYKNKEPWII